MWEKWVIDVSVETLEGTKCFVPFEPPGTIVSGMNIIANKSPGELIGIFHSEGQEAVEKWESENPDWHKTYSKEGI